MLKNNTLISLDFDGTLFHLNELQEFAKRIIKEKYIVGITTRRTNIPCNNPGFHNAYNSHEVYDLANKLGIKIINFLHLEKKVDFLNTLKCNVIHIDDDEKEINEINRHYVKNRELFEINTFQNVCFSINELNAFKEAVYLLK